MNFSTPTLKGMVIVLAVIGLISVVAFIGMLGMHWTMHGMMTNAGTGQWMTSMCNVATIQ